MPALYDIKPDMNVTPLVDVVLVLLIIFMVVAPQMEPGAAVNLPGIQKPDKKAPTDEAPITVSLAAGGRLYLEKEPMSQEDLKAALIQIRKNQMNRRLVLRADRAVRYGQVKAIFAECQSLGFPGIALQVGKRKEK